MNKFRQADRESARMLKYGDTNGRLEMFVVHLPFSLCVVKSKEGKYRLANKYKWMQSIK